MIHEFDDALRADPERFELAKNAALLLDGIAATTSARVTAEWRSCPRWSEGPLCDHPPHRIFLEVVLRDDEGTVTTGHLGGTERDDPRELKYRMARIWGDFLEQRSLLFYSRLVEPNPEIGVTQV